MAKTLEAIRQIRKMLKTRTANAEYQRKHAEHLKELNSNPELLEKKRETMKKLLEKYRNSPELQAKRLQALRNVNKPTKEITIVDENGNCVNVPQSENPIFM